MATIIKQNIHKLEQQYRMGDALISDEAFDHLDRNLVKTNFQNNYFNFKKRLCLPSLPNRNYKEFLGSLLKNTRLSIEPKINGCAIAIQYINGKLNKAISKKGFDVTSQIRKIKELPYSLPIKRDFQVRGELYATNQTSIISKKITKQYLDAERGIEKGLRFCCFQILNGRLNQYETLNYLKKCGFNTPNSYFTNFTSQVEFFRKEWLEKRLFSNYPTDGIVIKINSRKLQLIREKSYLDNKDWQYVIDS
tara:strand:- start:785 stop:1534 length:750 start_codon:yes stop_codon:yes gene_type:complete